MQTCSRCRTAVPDSVPICPTCQADLHIFSESAVALKNFQDNPRVNAVILIVSQDACPACLAAQGTYAKEKTPVLPIEGCSNPSGCHCFYQPLLEEIFP